MSFNEHTTHLHDIEPDPVFRQRIIDQEILLDALAGNRGDDQQRIAIEVIRWGALLLRKNKDYGCAVWQIPVLAPDCDPGTAIRVRMSDKVSRLSTLLQHSAEVRSESIDDTLRDLGAYCLLELARPGRSPAKESDHAANP